MFPKAVWYLARAHPVNTTQTTHHARHLQIAVPPRQYPQSTTPRQTADSSWPPLTGMHTLPEPEGQIAHSLGSALDLDLFVVGERVVLCGDACVVDHGTCVGGEAGHGASEVTVNFHDLFDGA